MVEESTVSASTRAMEGADEEAAHRGAGHGVARDAMRALRLSLAAGLLVLACVLGVALAVRGGAAGWAELEQAQALTPQQVCVFADA
jgi:hypothetical protein